MSSNVAVLSDLPRGTWGIREDTMFDIESALMKLEEIIDIVT